MTVRGGTRIRATKKPVVVVAGEDRHDRIVLRTLLEEFCPAMRGRIVEISDSVRLRMASDGKLSERIKALARKALARAARERADLACVFVHEDFDRAVSDDYSRVQERVQAALRRELGTAHYVLAAAETEAWLLLFPEAISQTKASWRVPRQYQCRDTARIDDPKRVMVEEVSQRGPRYRESDAPEVIGKALELGIVRQPAGTNESWGILRGDSEECCRKHIR